MALLRDLRADASLPLFASHRVGRGSDMDLVLEDPGLAVSREHAILRWTTDGWVVRDLGSTNGTWLARQRLSSGEDTPLPRGATLSFGRHAHYRVEDAGPPLPAASCLSGGVVIFGEAGILPLPSTEAPEWTVLAEVGADWTAWHGSVATSVQDRSVIVVDGRSWRLHLPSTLPPTVAAASTGSVELFLWETDEPDRFSARLEIGGRRVDLQQRAHHRILYALARERARVERRGKPIQEAAVRVEDLIEHLGQNRATFYVHLHRLRAQLVEAGLPDGEPVLQRTALGELYLGAARVQIASPEPTR